MYIISVEFTIDPEHLESFHQAVLKQAENSVNLEPDCHEFVVSISESDPARFFLYEVYSDREAFDAHLQTPHFQSFVELVGPWITSRKLEGWHRL